MWPFAASRNDVGAGSCLPTGRAWRRAACMGRRAISGAAFRRTSTKVWEATTASLVLAVLLYGGVFVAPYVALAMAWAYPTLLGAAVVGVAANLLTRILLAARFGHSLVSVVLHPFAVLALLALSYNSRRWSTAGAQQWAGRTYPDRKARLEATG